MKKLVFIGVFLSSLVGCSSKPISLPSNVTTIPSGIGDSTYLDKINHSFENNNSVSFDKIKLCSVETFNNDGVMLKDAAGSFVGAYTGHYYHNSNNNYIQGGSSLKYEDKNTLTLIATGTTKTKAQQGGVIVDYVKYDAKITMEGNKINLIFQNISAAQQNTGASANDGFRQVGTWAGARAPGVISAIDMLANRFKSCVNQK